MNITNTREYLQALREYIRLNNQRELIAIAGKTSPHVEYKLAEFKTAINKFEKCLKPPQLMTLHQNVQSNFIRNNP